MSPRIISVLIATFAVWLGACGAHQPRQQATPVRCPGTLLATVYNAAPEEIDIYEGGAAGRLLGTVSPGATVTFTLSPGSSGYVRWQRPYASVHNVTGSPSGVNPYSRIRIDVKCAP